MSKNLPLKLYTYGMFNKDPFRLPVIKIHVVDKDSTKARIKSTFLSSHMMFHNISLKGDRLL
jgi:hypothetical protein